MGKGRKEGSDSAGVQQEGNLTCVETRRETGDKWEQNTMHPLVRNLYKRAISVGKDYPGRLPLPCVLVREELGGDCHKEKDFGGRGWRVGAAKR